MPQAILLQDVETLGERGAVVDVSPGYLRNYLLPRKLAEPATAGSIKAATRRREAAERAVKDAAERAQENAALLGRTVLTITQQAGDDGRLFGSVTTQDIAEAIRDARGIKVDRRKIRRRVAPVSLARASQSSLGTTESFLASLRERSCMPSRPLPKIDRRR